MGGRHRRQPPRHRAWRRRRGHRRIRKVRGELLANAGPREFRGTRGRRRRPTRLVPPPRQGVIRAGEGGADGGGWPRMPSPAPRVERSTSPARGDGRRRSGPALEPPARRTKSWRTLTTRRCGSGRRTTAARRLRPRPARPRPRPPASTMRSRNSTRPWWVDSCASPAASPSTPPTGGGPRPPSRPTSTRGRR